MSIKKISKTQPELFEFNNIIFAAAGVELPRIRSLHVGVSILRRI